MSHSGTPRGRLLALTYHYVRDAGGPYPGIHPIAATALRAQIQELMRTLHAATPQQAEQFLHGKAALPRDSFLVTFDDGLVDHLHAAQQVLAPLGVCAAFFVPTRPLVEQRAPVVHKIHWLRAHVPPQEFERSLRAALPAPWSAQQLNDDQRARAARMHIHDAPAAQTLKYFMNFVVPSSAMDIATTAMLSAHGMSEAQLCRSTFLDAAGVKQLAALGHTVGLHGHTHTAFSALDAAALDAELSVATQTLGNIVGTPPTWLSYPYGRRDALPPDARAVCARHGVAVGLTLLPGWNDGTQDPALALRITPNELAAHVGARTQDSAACAN